MITEISIANVSLALLTHNNNVLVTCEPPSCSHPDLWRLNKSACEPEENENGCRSVIEHESKFAKFSAMIINPAITRILKQGHDNGDQV